MEEVLDLYAEPADLQRPRVCIDEMPYQLQAEKREPLPPEGARPRREDFSYTQEGMCNIFGLFQPESGWRHFTVTERRTTVDFAHLLKDLVDVHFPEAQCIRVIADNLNTHSPHA